MANAHHLILSRDAEHRVDGPIGCRLLNVICFVACDEAAMMNGSIVTVDGGASVVDPPTVAIVE